MALFPKIVSACPYKGKLSDIMDGETCRLCNREVYDLTDMDDGARAAFLAACSGETCVTYRAPKNAIFATAAALATMALPLALVAALDRPGSIAPGLGWAGGNAPAPIGPLTPADIDDTMPQLTGMIDFSPGIPISHDHANAEASLEPLRDKTPPPSPTSNSTHRSIPIATTIPL